MPPSKVGGLVDWPTPTGTLAALLRLSGLYTIRREHKERSGNFKGPDREQRGHLGVDIMKIHCMHE